MPFPPTPSQTPSNTPTPSITPSNTPTNTPSSSACPDIIPSQTPTNTTTTTPTTTPTPTCACLKFELSTSFTNPVFNYTDCNGIPQTIQIGFFSTQDICAQSVIEPSGGGVEFLGCCDIIPTLTPTSTPTNTPTNTQTGTPTNTQTPTPTPTGEPEPPQEYYYYSIRSYDCTNNCAVISPDLIGRSSIQLSTTSGTYYKVPNSGFGSVVFQVQTEITPAPFGFDVDMDNTSATGADCSSVCNA